MKYLLALLLLPGIAGAQALVNCAPATPCSSTTGPINTGSGDPAWKAFGKVNEDLSAGTLPVSISGTAGTATALAATPTLCAAAQSAIGVDAGGNAVGCFTVAGAGTVNSGTLGYIGYYAANGTAISGLAVGSNTLLGGVGSGVAALTPAQSIAILNSAAVNAQTGTAYSLALGDANSEVSASNSSANAVCVLANASVAFAVGTLVTIEQTGTGLTTLYPAGAGGCAGSGVTFQSPQAGSSASVGYPLGGTYGYIQIQQTATDTWIVANYNPGLGTFTLTGTCTSSASAGNARAGTVTMSSAGNCTIIITPAGVLPAAHGYEGTMGDRAQPTLPSWHETSSSTTAITFTVPTAVLTTEVVSFDIRAY